MNASTTATSRHMRRSWKRLEREGLRGVTVSKDKEGYGEPSIVHAAHVVDPVFDLPIVIEPVDQCDRIAARFGVADEQSATTFIGTGSSYLIGIVIASAQTLAAFDPLWYCSLATRVFGGYTTSSTFSYKALGLGDGRDLMTLLSVAVSVVLGIIGAMNGVATAKAIGG